MSARVAFERWLRAQARYAPRIAGSEEYAHAQTQQQWLVWQAAWNSAMAQASSDPCSWVETELLRRIERTLEFYADPRNYGASRIGGVLGRPFGARRTPQQLSRSARVVLDALRNSSTEQSA